MTNNIERYTKYIPYKEAVKKRALEYYYANKEVTSEKNKNRYKSLLPEEKKKRQEYNNQWVYRQSPEKQAKLRKNVRDYHKNRYDNLMVAVKYII